MTLGIFSNFPILVLKVINFYMELLAERSTSDLKLPKVYAFNTFFMVNSALKATVHCDNGQRM